MNENIQCNDMSNASSRTALVNELKNILAERLNISIEKIEEEKDIAKFGIDSLKFLLLVEKINTHFNCQFSVEQIYDNFTINALAQLITQSSGGK